MPALEQWRYRNKLEYSFGDRVRHGSLVCGFHAPAGGNAVVPIEDCLLASERGNLRTGGGAALVSRAGARPPGSVESGRRGRPGEDRERTASGPDGRARLRNLVVREGRRTGKLQIRIVTTDGELDAGSLAQALSEALGREPVSGVLWTRSRSLAETTAGGDTELVWGEAELPERLGELDLRISPEAFFQTNTEMAELLYSIVVEYAALEGWERVYDLYSGIGTIALTLASRAGELWGIELIEEAVADAIAAARRNEIPGVQFFAGDTRLALAELVERAGRPDVLVVDPPRAGLSQKVVRRIIEASPKRIVYVSCNPTTLAPNAAQLQRGRLDAAQGPPGRHVSADAPHRVRRPLRARSPARSAPRGADDRDLRRARLPRRPDRLPPMRAATIRDQQIVIEEHPDPVPAAGEVLVRVRAAGLNGGDMMQLRGLLPGAARLPAGHPRHGARRRWWLALGPGAERFAVGDRVMAIVGGGAQAELDDGARAPADAGPASARLARGGRLARGLHHGARRDLHPGRAAPGRAPARPRRRRRRGHAPRSSWPVRAVRG